MLSKALSWIGALNLIYLCSVKYEYAYKTPDGVRHVEEMDAPSREIVFQTLRERGIRAIKVVAKDGSKANGEVRIVGVKKRVTLALVISVAIISGIISCFVTRETITPSSPEPNEVDEAGPIDPPKTSPTQMAMPLARQRIQGDRRRIDNAPTNLFATAVETYLSKFAEPGREVTPTETSTLVTNEFQLVDILSRPIRYSEDEFSEHIDLKRITAGLKREMRNYMRGGHTSTEYFQELVKRQQIEIDYRAKAEKKLEEMLKGSEDKQAAYDFWMKANVQLQNMGIYPLPMPDQLRDLSISFDLD